MNRIALVVGVVASLLLGGTSTALAGPPDTSTVITRDNAVSFPVVNPCTGEAGNITLEFTEVLHIKPPPGTLIHHYVDVQTGTLAFTPDGSTTPTVSGHFGTTLNFESTPPGDADAITQPLMFVAHGTDGSNLVVHSLFHFTETPAGDDPSVFDLVTIECEP
jgi:hypothetical protein